MKNVPTRFLLAASTFLISVLMYVDRACIGAAKDDISSDFNLTNIQWAWVMAAFTLGYALFQTPSGKLADARGPRVIMAAIITAWSALTALTGAAWNTASMLVVRFLFGAAEAGGFPTLSKVTFNWYPIKERGIIQGINFSGSRLGGAIAYPIVVVLIAALGWKMTFVVFGLVGLLFAGAWWLVFRDKPEETRYVSEEEKRYIMENRQRAQTDRSQVAPLPFLRIISNPNMGLAMVQYVASNFTFYFTLTWMFPYLKEGLQGAGTLASFYAMAPLIGGAIGNWVSGFMVDGIYKSSGSLTLSRRIPAIVGFVLATAGMLLVTTTMDPVMRVIFLTIAIFGADMTLSPSWAFCIDIGKEHSGSVSGTMNMAGNLGAFSSILVFGYLADSLIQAGASPTEAIAGNTTFFVICGCLNAVAIGLWLLMNPNKSLVAEAAAQGGK